MFRYIIICLPLLILVLIISWMVALTIEHYAGHHHWSSRMDRSSLAKTDKILLASQRRYKNGINISDEYKNIFTFVQITDIHISKFRDITEIVSDLKKLCREQFPLIKPKVVLVSGDLTDAKAENKLFSRQYVDEWVAYRNAIDYCNQHYETVWLDVKGNHDDFGVPNAASEMNFYNRFGSSRERFNKSRFFKYILTTDYGNYAFNGLDLTPSTGPRRPFNFFGMFTKEDVESLDAITVDSNKYNLSFWFGHYPLSVTTASSYLRQKVRTGIVYLCGHLHTLGGLVPQMYARPQDGHLELESGDWKTNRRYRIMAVDHDIFSFVDATFPEMPIVLITNPKDARFLVPEKEPIDRAVMSSHIRFFVFSPLKIYKVAVFVDERILCNNARKAAESFYVCAWNPIDFKTGFHNMKIVVEDSDKRQTSTEIDFSLDGTKKLLPIAPAVLMLTDFCVLAKVMYFAAYICIVIWPLCIRSATREHLFGRIVIVLLRITPNRIVNFAKTDHLFWPLFSFSVYLATGPLFFGEIVPNSIGICFVHGIYSNGIWIQEPLTYTYGTLLLITYNVPIMVLLGQKETTLRRSAFHLGMADVRHRKVALSFIWKILVSLGCTFFQVYLIYTLYACYGVISVFLSPSALWAFIFALWLLCKDLQLN